MAKKTKEADDERELREVFRVFDKNSRGVIDVRRNEGENSIADHLNSRLQI